MSKRTAWNSTLSPGKGFKPRKAKAKPTLAELKAEASWEIGGIAFHKKQDLEQRLKKHLNAKMLREDGLQTATRMCQEELQQLADEGHWSPGISAALDKCRAVLDPA